MRHPVLRISGATAPNPALRGPAAYDQEARRCWSAHDGVRCPSKMVPSPAPDDLRLTQHRFRSPQLRRRLKSRFTGGPSTVSAAAIHHYFTNGVSICHEQMVRVGGSGRFDLFSLTVWWILRRHAVHGKIPTVCQLDHRFCGIRPSLPAPHSPGTIFTLLRCHLTIRLVSSNAC
jgi:hypothetical protein